MATFARGHSSRTIHEHNRKVILKASGESTIVHAKVTWIVDPSDAITLRGIPAIGRGVAGVIRGTNPQREIEQNS